MRDRSEQILRSACLVLAALVLASLVRAGCRAGALIGAKIPPVPVLETNSISATNAPASTKGSNAPPAVIQATNAPASAAGTNAAANRMTNAIAGGSNLVSVNITMPKGTNNLPAAETNSAMPAVDVTNVPPEQAASGISTNQNATTTNLAGNVSAAAGTNAVAIETNGLPPAGTNSSASAVAQTNIAPEEVACCVSSNQLADATNMPAQVSGTAGTNAVAGGTNSISVMVATPGGTNGLLAAGTNSVDAAKSTKRSKTNSPPQAAVAGGVNSGGPPGMPGKAAKLPPEIQARVDKIVNSEIFAPVIHPLPMALLGIAGDTAFLRTASGQTGLVKSGDSLGDLKLLQIGINRVLVEQDGQKKELTIFNGFGGDSLLTNRDETKK